MIETVISNKWLMLALLPFSIAILFGGWLVIYTRGGRPLMLKLKGFGISVEIDTHTTRNVSHES